MPRKLFFGLKFQQAQDSTTQFNVGNVYARKSLISKTKSFLKSQLNDIVMVIVARILKANSKNGLNFYSESKNGLNPSIDLIYWIIFDFLINDLQIALKLMNSVNALFIIVIDSSHQ